MVEGRGRLLIAEAEAIMWEERAVLSSDGASAILAAGMAMRLRKTHGDSQSFGSGIR